jgi:hypothetical protein
MRLLPSDPDIETIVGRIKSGDLDLQPEFQRGEVWPRAKKQRLIDSVLRDWHIPPVHVIEQSRSKKQEVLDGQQRLAAIRDFVDNMFPVDGMIEPFDPALQNLNGIYYKDLKEDWRRQFNQFTIRIFRIVDYKASEPAELFFRLNQPASLTGAEQRNAFFGPVREQIRHLVGSLENTGLDRFLGFSNSRMAYDDVLARTAFVVQRKTLADKVTSTGLAALYRSDSPLDDSTVHLIDYAVTTFTGIQDWHERTLKFNKATFFSWLLFIVRGVLANDPISKSKLGDFLSFFEDLRNKSAYEPERANHLLAGCAPTSRLFSVYQTRSAARVADVSSVILRDAVIWLSYEEYAPVASSRLTRLHAAFSPGETSAEDDVLARRLIDAGWGNLQ